MFSHIMLGTSNFDAAKEFYDKVLATLGAGPGMINVASTGHKRAFWMHNTPSSLDIIYNDPRGVIVSIAPNAPPNSDALIPSNGPASGVLELRAGRAAEIGAKAGDRVRHPFFAE